ncbi:MAG: hypothetical protein LBH22_08975 [Bacteroidales bacterium]|jgi:hypothetical protein|nr:hypothetical protein [Bacteroidales bacterium]
MVKLNFWSILLFLIISFTVNAQTISEYNEVDEKIAQFTSPIDGKVINKLVAFINDNFSTETDKLRAITVWIANNFDYDIENMDTYKYYSELQEVIDAILKNKKGICAHFANLFSEIANRLGTKTYVVSGYTGKFGFINSEPHAWCASFVDSAWFLIDPTWFTGHRQGQEFVKKQNDYYFKAVPEDLIKSHMPFDPLWQFLYYPVSPQEFNEGRTIINEENPFFNYVDTLKVYENSSAIERLVSTLRRIEQFNENNTLTANQLQHIESEKECYKNRISIAYYNSAVDFYNEGVDKLNSFINQWNKKQITQKPEAEIRIMIKSIEKTLNNSQNELQKINTTNPTTIKSINEFKISINGTFARVKDLKDFIDKHFSTKKPVKR